MKPVTDGKKNISEMRPDTGVHCSMPEKRMISRRPHQKIGMEKPISAVPMMIWSNIEPRLMAAKTPAGMPSTMAKRMAQSDSSSVAGNSSRNCDSTESLVVIDVPKSPRSTPQR